MAKINLEKIQSGTVWVYVYDVPFDDSPQVLQLKNGYLISSTYQTDGGELFEDFASVEEYEEEEDEGKVLRINACRQK